MDLKVEIVLDTIGCKIIRTTMEILLSSYLGGETTKLDLLTVHDVARIGILPLLGDNGILVGVDQKVKSTRLIEQRQERDTGSDLSDNGLNFIVDFLDGFVACGGLFVGVAVFSGFFVFNSHVELPAFQGLARVNASNDDNQALHISVQKPSLDLLDNLAQVLQKASVCSSQYSETILGFLLESLGHVDS